MNAKAVILACALFVAGWAVGALTRGGTRQRQASVASETTSARGLASSEKATSARVRTMAAAQVPESFEAQLQAIMAMPRQKRWNRIRDAAKSVAPGDEMSALAIAERILSRQEMQNFRWNLAEIWAERDYKGLLAYSRGSRIAMSAINSFRRLWSSGRRRIRMRRSPGWRLSLAGRSGRCWSRRRCAGWPRVIRSEP
jgi:hypothetical protein